MRNKKNGSGSKVRRPITTSAPKSDNSKKKDDNEPKVTTLMIAGALAVAAVILIAVATLFVIRGDAPAQAASITGKPSEAVQAADAEHVLDAVYIALFTYGLDKTSIKEKTEVASDDSTEIKMLLDPAHIETIELKRTISEKLSEIGMTVSDADGLSAVNPLVKIAITFTTDKVVEKPVVKKPLPNSIAFVIDDCGYSEELARELADIPYPITMAIIPHTKFASETAKIGREKGKTIFLHQPMQPVSYPKTDPGKGAILLNMPEKLIKASLESNVASVGSKIDGFNNHMGSAITQDKQKMQQIFKYIRPYTTTFVDSYTAANTVAYDECKAAGFECGINRKFIDNESDYGYIRSKIIEGAEIARSDGNVIMIGHLRENTVHALKKIMPELEKAGYHLVSALELTQK
jgi:polysaccharide deacetylase 2 family uncharacterized protein YibQ